MRILSIIALLALLSSSAVAVDPEKVTYAKLQNREVFQFPLTLGYREGIFNGHALLLLELDAKGRVQDAVCLQASHPVFAEVALNGLEKARFTPAREDGEAIPIRQPLELMFSSSGGVHSVNVLSQLKRNINEGKGFTLTPENQLDEPLELKKRGEYELPTNEDGETIQGRAVATFYVSRDGTIHLPKVISLTDYRLHDVAVEFLQNSVFSIPRFKGKPVAVKVKEYECVLE